MRRILYSKIRWNIKFAEVFFCSTEGGIHYFEQVEIFFGDPRRAERHYFHSVRSKNTVREIRRRISYSSRTLCRCTTSLSYSPLMYLIKRSTGSRSSREELRDNLLFLLFGRSEQLTSILSSWGTRSPLCTAHELNIFSWASSSTHYWHCIQK